MSTLSPQATVQRISLLRPPGLRHAATDRERWTLAHELRHLVLPDEYVTGEAEADGSRPSF